MFQMKLRSKKNFLVQNISELENIYILLKVKLGDVVKLGDLL